MKYKNRQEVKYLLFFVFHMFFQYFQCVVPTTSPYAIIFKIENIMALLLLILAIGYEIYERQKFDKNNGNPYKKITKDEISCVVIIVVAVIISLWNPFQK